MAMEDCNATVHSGFRHYLSEHLSDHLEPFRYLHRAARYISQRRLCLSGSPARLLGHLETVSVLPLFWRKIYVLGVVVLAANPSLTYYRIEDIGWQAVDRAFDSRDEHAGAHEGNTLRRAGRWDYFSLANCTGRSSCGEARVKAYRSWRLFAITDQLWTRSHTEVEEKPYHYRALYDRLHHSPVCEDGGRDSQS